MTFGGYYGNEEATAAAVVDGWYHTGDLAEIDDDGYLAIIGRARDIIRTGGESVAPVEVEGVLRSHPTIDDLAVVGIPDPQWGEIVCACIVLKDGEEPPTVEDLRAHCGDRLASYKHPRQVAVVQSIPRTASNNKVQRRLLVEQITVL
jgi:acyl-CoA synthetase (AMP-forming)/AMP-acid ligase II